MQRIRDTQFDDPAGDATVCVRLVGGRPHLAEQFDGPTDRQEAHYSLGHTLYLLGDLAQATAPAAQSSWEAVVATLGAPAAATVEELALGYRVPASIMDVANRLLPEVAPGVRAAGSVRTGGRPPSVVGAAAGDLAAVVADRVAGLAEEWGSVGVVVPDELGAGVASALGEAGVAFAHLAEAAGTTCLYAKGGAKRKIFSRVFGG